MKQPLFFKIFKDGKVIEIKQFSKQQVVIGRQGEIDLQLQDPDIFPIHATVEEREDGKYFICDLGSPVGTKLNGKSVVDEPIKDGDTIVIGSYSIEFSVGIPKPKGMPQAVGPKPADKPPKVEEVEADPIYSRNEPPKPKVVPEAPKKPARTPTPAPTLVSAAPGGGTVVHKTPSTSTSKGTFAPPSRNKSLKEAIRPGKGGVVELILGWHDRVLTTYHFEKRQIIHVGSHPKNEVVPPNIGSIRVSHPLIRIDGGATILLATDMSGSVHRENNVTVSFDELKRQGSMQQSGGGFSYRLQQNEVVQINLGENISIWIRFVGNAPPILFAPLLDLTLNQLTALIVGLLAVGLFLVYMFLYAPQPEEKPEEETEPPRRAQFVYKQPAVEGEKTQETKVKSETKSAQASDATEKIKDQAPAPSRSEPGKASEAAPNKSKSKEKKLTAVKPGKDKGIKVGAGAAKPDSPAAVTQPQKDVKSSGLLGVFGKSGVQEQLNRANQGSGLAGGVAKSASGSGSDTAGSGITPGAGMRDVGQGGTGTATVGIAGVHTKGRGGGTEGYGTGSIGGKKNATVMPGGDEATFQGTIDRDAIRRVVQQHIKEIKACYEKGLNKDPGLYGKISIQWTIGAGGRVTEAGIKSTTMNSPEVENCAVSRLRTWKFPEPPSDQEAIVSFPFVFQAQE